MNTQTTSRPWTGGSFFLSGGFAISAGAPAPTAKPAPTSAPAAKPTEAEPDLRPSTLFAQRQEAIRAAKTRPAAKAPTEADIFSTSAADSIYQTRKTQAKKGHHHV
jgi:hypothetical protein